MAQEFTLGEIPDDGYMGTLRLPQVFTLGTIPDEGYMGTLTLQREWDHNASTPFPTGAPTQSSVLPETALQVVDLDHEHVAWLPQVRGGYGARLAINEAGAVEGTLQRTDPALTTTLAGDRIIRCWYRGQLFAAGLHAPQGGPTLANGEENAETRTIGGSGTFAYLDRAVVLPWVTDWKPDMQAHRFGPFHPLYNYMAHPTAKIKAYQGLPSPHWTGNPNGWDDPEAAWISGSQGSAQNAPAGDLWAWGIVTVTDNGADHYAGKWTGDNTAELWLDGIPLSTVQNWKSLQEATIELTPGSHLFAAKVTNYAQSLSNPMGFLFSLRTIRPAGRGLGLVVLRSNADWRVLQFPAQPPGMPLGQILNYLLDQAEEQLGITISRSFTETADSGGRAFPIVTDLTVQCGVGIGQAILQLAEAYLDVQMGAGSWTLHAWNKNTGGRDLGLNIDQAGDDACLARLDHEVRGPVCTGFLGRWQDNSVLRERTPPAGYGPNIRHIQLPQVPTRAGALEVLDSLLDIYNREQVQTTAGIKPRNDAQAAIRPGDRVNLPNRDLDLEEMTIQSMSVEVNDAGEVDLQIQAGDRIATEETNIEAWLTLLADGALEGRTRQALPPRGDTYRVGRATVVTQEIEFDRDDAVTAFTSRQRTIRRTGFIVEVTADIPDGSPGSFDIEVNGEVVTTLVCTGATLTSDTNLGIAVERYDVLTVTSTDTGFGVVVVVGIA